MQQVRQLNTCLDNGVDRPPQCTVTPVHAVSERDITPHSRRLVNIIGEVYKALPEGLFVKEQKWSAPWRRRWARWKGRLGG